MNKKELAEQIAAILSHTKYRLPVSDNDKAVYVVDIPKATAAIIEAMGEKPEAEVEAVQEEPIALENFEKYLGREVRVEISGYWGGMMYPDRNILLGMNEGEYFFKSIEEDGSTQYWSMCYKDKDWSCQVFSICAPNKVEAMGVQPGMSEENYVAGDSNTDESSVASHSCTNGNAIEQLMQEPIRKKLINDFINRTCYPTAIQGRYGNWMSFSDMLNSFLFDVLNSIDNKAGWVQVGNSEPNGEGGYEN